jgi:hypothetical protein
MNYSSLYDFVKDTCLALGSDVKFFHGRKELITLTTDVDRATVYAFSLPFTSSGSLTNNVQQVNEIYAINLIFYKQDQEDSGIDQNDQDSTQSEITVLTQTNAYADEFVRRINANEDITIMSFSKGNAIKDTAHLLTGTTLSMSVRIFDGFDYCTIN